MGSAMSLRGYGAQASGVVPGSVEFFLEQSCDAMQSPSSPECENPAPISIPEDWFYEAECLERMARSRPLIVEITV
jgi:hypothetical protein